MVAYVIQTNEFTGPLDKLLELIEGEKLPITEVSLAKVTDGFVKYLAEQSGALDPQILADFLVVAARLLLIKSKTLIPDFKLTEEEEYEVKDLESRLEIYRLFAARGGPASEHLNERWERTEGSYARPFLAAVTNSTVFLPTENLTLADIRGAAERMAKELQEIIPETSKVKVAIISIEEKIRELMERFTQAVASNFKHLTKDKPRSEIIVMFLAVLHLLKKQEISVEQGEQFGDIMLRKK